MKLKVRKGNQDGSARIETAGAIKEIVINEDFLHPGAESISICFKGKNSSGIIDITPEEFEQIQESLKGRLHLIRGMKTFTYRE